MNVAMMVQTRSPEDCQTQHNFQASVKASSKNTRVSGKKKEPPADQGRGSQRWLGVSVYEASLKLHICHLVDVGNNNRGVHLSFIGQSDWYLDTSYTSSYDTIEGRYILMWNDSIQFDSMFKRSSAI